MCSPIATALFVGGASLLHLQPKFSITGMNLVRELSSSFCIRGIFLPTYHFVFFKKVCYTFHCNFWRRERSSFKIFTSAKKFLWNDLPARCSVMHKKLVFGH